MKPAPKSLYGKLVLSVSTIIVAVVSTFAVVTFMHHAARMEETEQKTVILMARSLSLVCADYLLADDYAAMETYLKRYAILPNILNIEVFDARGNALADIIRENGEARARFAGAGRRSLVVPVAATPALSMEKGRIIVLHPIGEGDTLGWVRLQYGIGGIELLLKDIFKNTAAASLLGIFIGLAALIVVLRPVSRAIREIAAFAKNLNERKGETIPVLEGVSEIEDLSLALNETSLKLFTTEQSLIRSRASVEEHAKRLMEELAERRRAEDKLARSAQELKESHEDLRAFVYSAAHDLRGPLVNIKGFTAEIKKGLEENVGFPDSREAELSEQDRQRISEMLHKTFPEALQFISSSADRMDELITAMLKLSHMGRRELKPERIDMDKLVRSLLVAMKSRIEERGVKVTLGPLPPVEADRDFMEHIAANMLDNALKYLDPSRSGEVELSGERVDAETVYHVRDNGRGIDSADIPKVFEMFRRLGDRNVPGVGMGLTYVKALVRRHGGRIWCESEPGTGSVFSFTMPHDAGDSRQETVDRKQGRKI